MLDELEQVKLPRTRRRRRASARPAPTIPPSLAFTEQAAAILQQYLLKHSLGHYGIYYVCKMDLDDLERILDLLDDAARWEPLPPLTRNGASITPLTHNSTQAWTWPTGCLHLHRQEVVLARWYWEMVEDRGQLRCVDLCAAPSPEHYLRLRDEVRGHRRTRTASTWQIVAGYAWRDGPRMARDAALAPDLILSDELRRRIQSDIVRFFDDEVARLYESLKVPYRRGILLHGPPGNGKTSLIRQIGLDLPKTPIMILRPIGGFDDDDLQEVIRRWRNQAPAILVIEDLNWLLQQVNLSTFLNLIDGVECALTGGLLLIATTNHPDKLDTAVNNRPGRFDVVIEVPNPTATLRLEFFRTKLPETPPNVHERLCALSEGLSFAHLQETLRLSGLFAIEAGRSVRSEENLVHASNSIRESHEDMMRGYVAKPPVPFGLAQRRHR